MFMFMPLRFNVITIVEASIFLSHLLPVFLLIVVLLNMFVAALVKQLSHFLYSSLNRLLVIHNHLFYDFFISLESKQFYFLLIRLIEIALVDDSEGNPMVLAKY